MPRLISEVTEIATGLGTLGFLTPDEALERQPVQLIDVPPEVWSRIGDAWRADQHREEFLAGLANGRALLNAPDGLRGRLPIRVEWRGPSGSPGDEVTPADLRIDHVYLVSCKYLSRITVNASPSALFERLLTGGQGRRTVPDWFVQVAPAEHQSLYEAVRRHYGHTVEADGSDLPMRSRDLDTQQRAALREALPKAWHAECVDAYEKLSRAVSTASAERWESALPTIADQRAMLWRLLRIGAAPYFILGSARGRTLRLRVGTPWDWHRAFDLRSFEIDGDGTGQPRLSWHASIRNRDTRDDLDLDGHVEIRWSHGRFNRPPEAKVYLDTPHGGVPGYWPLPSG
jgi:hypothetical protein